MNKMMLIDAAHPEETRVAVVNGETIEDFDFETLAKKQLRGNIYLAKVTRVEPSLQAAFVEYGGNRHGFLAFGEIHPDYYQIPIEDREALLREARTADHAEDDDADDDSEALSEGGRRYRRALRKYKIQEVIRRRQIMLVQVVKEERGSKGAALTSFISLAGRYCVLMPNTARGGGISRKITNAVDRKRLKKIATELEVPDGMGLIVRTAGAKRTKSELKRDYDYLLRLWDSIRDTTLKSIAPALVYEEGSLVRRSLRDLYDKEVDQIHVEGDAAYREAKEFVRMLMPSHAKKVQAHRETAPIFTKFKIEPQLETIYSPTVRLKSGGYLVINQTEALVAIDVNSGKSTGERSIESTAYRTNMEAADEASKQMRLRDLAGLIVIDFIDMEDAKNVRAVEKRMKDSLRFDRARVQMGRISNFGLLEISRQRRRNGLMEGITTPCEQCQGAGRIRTPESAALALLRSLEETAARGPAQLSVSASLGVALYLLNDKRAQIGNLEERAGVVVRITADPHIAPGTHSIDRTPLLLADDGSDSDPVVGLDTSSPVRAEKANHYHADDNGRETRSDTRWAASADNSRPHRQSSSDANMDGDETGAQRPRRDRNQDRDRSRSRGRDDAAKPRNGAPTNGEVRQAIKPTAASAGSEGETGSTAGTRRRRNRRRRGSGNGGVEAIGAQAAIDPLAVIDHETDMATETDIAQEPGTSRDAGGYALDTDNTHGDDEPRRRRRRGRRGGRRRREGGNGDRTNDAVETIALDQLQSSLPIEDGDLVAIDGEFVAAKTDRPKRAASILTGLDMEQSDFEGTASEANGLDETGEVGPEAAPAPEIVASTTRRPRQRAASARAKTESKENGPTDVEPEVDAETTLDQHGTLNDGERNTVSTPAPVADAAPAAARIAPTITSAQPEIPDATKDANEGGDDGQRKRGWWSMRKNLFGGS